MDLNKFCQLLPNNVCLQPSFPWILLSIWPSHLPAWPNAITNLRFLFVRTLEKSIRVNLNQFIHIFIAQDYFISCIKATDIGLQKDLHKMIKGSSNIIWRGILKGSASVLLGLMHNKLKFFLTSALWIFLAFYAEMTFLKEILVVGCKFAFHFAFAFAKKWENAFWLWIWIS